MMSVPWEREVLFYNEKITKESSLQMQLQFLFSNTNLTQGKIHVSITSDVKQRIINLNFYEGREVVSNNPEKGGQGEIGFNCK